MYPATIYYNHNFIKSPQPLILTLFPCPLSACREILEIQGSLLIAVLVDITRIRITPRPHPPLSTVLQVLVVIYTGEEYAELTKRQRPDSPYTVCTYVCLQYILRNE